jgi:hypothetical protein
MRGMVVAVQDGVALAATDHRPVHRRCDQERHGQGTRQRCPEQSARQAGVQGAGDGEHHRVVEQFHDRDRDGIGRQGDPERGAQADARTQHPAHGQAVAEDER